MRRFLVLVATFAVVGVAVLGSGRVGLGLAQDGTPDAGAGGDCPTTTPEENKELARRYFEEGYVNADAAVIDELLADDFNRNQQSRVAINEPGNAEDVARIEARLREFPDLAVVVEDLIAEGDKVVARLSWSGTHDGAFEDLGAPATGRRAEWTATVIFRVACGELAENWVESDLISRLRQTGIVTDDELATIGTPSVATPAP